MPRIFVEVEVTATGPFCSIQEEVNCNYYTPDRDTPYSFCELFRDADGNRTILEFQAASGLYLWCAACLNASDDPRQPGDEVQDPYPGSEYHTGHPTNLRLPNDRETLEAWARSEMKNARPEVEAELEVDGTPRPTAWDRLNEDDT
jgi:hypothetical protein